MRGQVKRTVILVSQEPTKRNGKARLHAYGIRAVAAVANASPKTVARAVAAQELEMGNLESVRRWTTNRRTPPGSIES